jgi:hypothetical protein
MIAVFSDKVAELLVGQKRNGDTIFDVEDPDNHHNEHDNERPVVVFEFDWKSTKTHTLREIYDRWYLGDKKYIAVAEDRRRKVIEVEPYVEIQPRKPSLVKLKSQAKNCIIYLGNVIRELHTVEISLRFLNEYASVDEVAKDIVFKSIFEHIKAKLKVLHEAGKTKSFPKNIDKLPFPSFYEHYLKHLKEVEEVEE